MSDFEVWAASAVEKQIPFLAHGRSYEGLDCWGLVWLAYKECKGIILRSGTEEYQPKDIYDFDKISRLISKYKPEWTPVEKGRAGDVILLRLTGRPIHVGLVLANGRMLHIEKGINVCVERYSSPVWKDRIVGIYRHNTAQ
jgi:cell wall-associated NlpC family hydrolase